MRSGMLLAVVAVVACDTGAAPTLDAAVDAVPVDADARPFQGVYDSPDDFPRTGCVPGSLAGFAHAEHWPQLGLRTALEPGLVTYRAWGEGERATPHQLTDDDLLLRQVTSFGGQWQLEAIDVCAVDADGPLRGTVAYCSESIPCRTFSVVAPPLRRIAGEADGEHLTLVGEFNGAPTWPGRTLDLAVDGDLAYLARGTDGLRIVDVTDPAHPRERGAFVAADDYWNDVEVLTVGGRRYAIGASNLTRVVDVTDPDAPVLVAEIPAFSHTVFLAGTVAYLAPDGSPVKIYDLADPRAPRLLSTIADHTAHDVVVAEGTAYLSEAFVGVVALDVADPAAPALVATADAPDRYWHHAWPTSVGGRRLLLSGDEGNATVLRVLDATPGATFLTTVGEWNSPRDLVSIHNFQAIATRAYVAHYQDGVRVLDLSDPAHPAPIAYFNTWREHSGPAGAFTAAFGVTVDAARRRLYVADSIRGLMILSGDATVFPQDAARYGRPMSASSQASTGPRRTMPPRSNAVRSSTPAARAIATSAASSSGPR